MDKGLYIPGKDKIYPPLLYFPRWLSYGLELKPRFHNRFHIALYDKDKYKRYGERAPKAGEAWAYNVFCNQGLDKIRQQYWTSSSYGYGRTPHTFMEYCGVGTGSGTPAQTDTSFFSYLDARDKATEGEVENPDTCSTNHTTQEYYHRHKFFWDLTEGNGSLTEVGLVYIDSGYDNLITHAMFQDAEGFPITVVKDSTKVMVITATVYLERGTSDSGAVVLDDGIEEIVEDQQDNGMLVWKEVNLGGYYSRAYIYLGDTDQAVDRSDCYEASYPVLGSTRSYKQVDFSGATSSGYGVALYSDWDLGEGNGTWYEVGYRSDIRQGNDFNLVRLDLPSGFISGNSLTKTSDKKLRVDLEFYYT